MSEKYFMKKILQSVVDEYQKNDIITASNFCLKLFNAANNGVIDYDNSNFCVLGEKDSLDKAIRIASLMPTTLTLTNINSCITEIDNRVICNRDGKFEDCAVYCHVPENDFTRIFLDASDLFINGIVKYYPNTIEIIGTDEEIVDERYLIRSPKGCVIKDEKEAMLSYSNMLNVNIPFVYDIPLDLFSKITLEHTEKLNNFREFFKKETLRLDFEKKNEKTSFEYELLDRTKEIEKLYESSVSKLRRKLVTSIVITTITSVLFLLIHQAW